MCLTRINISCNYRRYNYITIYEYLRLFSFVFRIILTSFHYLAGHPFQSTSIRDLKYSHNLVVMKYCRIALQFGNINLGNNHKRYCVASTLFMRFARYLGLKSMASNRYILCESDLFFGNLSTYIYGFTRFNLIWSIFLWILYRQYL